jgi:hypothetical protein
MDLGKFLGKGKTFWFLSFIFRGKLGVCALKLLSPVFISRVYHPHPRHLYKNKSTNKSTNK